ncbi:MAG TPA: universal stress protein [Candidatus Binatia bacterium]|jgi:nucleotide-binding universal stress UspA family protein|nr:universal stress protein [Candidatus Binatia bacterium]
MVRENQQQLEQPDEQSQELVIRRILVALDTSAHSLAALETAARLASSVHAELVGLFVEDINLLRLAALPFAKEMRWPSSARRVLDEARMERELQIMAAQARRALAMAAEQAEIEWTFRVVRGTVSDEVLNAALEVDLLSLGRASRPLTRRVRLGSTAQAAAARARGSVLLARKGANPELPIVVTYDGSRAGSRALMAAVHMAQSTDSNLIVLVMTDDAEEAPQLAEDASNLLKNRVAHAEYRYLPTEGEERLPEVLKQEACGLVVLGGESHLLEGERLNDLIDDLDCPVLLVR